MVAEGAELVARQVGKGAGGGIDEEGRGGSRSRLAEGGGNGGRLSVGEGDADAVAVAAVAIAVAVAARARDRCPAEPDGRRAGSAQRDKRQVGRRDVHVLVKVELEDGWRQAQVEQRVGGPVKVGLDAVRRYGRHGERTRRHGVARQVGKGAGAHMQHSAAHGGRAECGGHPALFGAREQERHRVGASPGRLDVGVGQGDAGRAGRRGCRDRQVCQVGRHGIDVLVEHNAQRAAAHVERGRMRRVEGGRNRIGDRFDERHAGRRRRVARQVGKGAGVKEEARGPGRIGAAGQQGALLGRRQEQPGDGRIAAVSLLHPLAARQPDRRGARRGGRQRDRRGRGGGRGGHVLVERHRQNSRAQVEHGGGSQGVERRRGRVQHDPGRKRGRVRQAVARHVAHRAGGDRGVQPCDAAAGRARQSGDGGLFVGRHCKQDGLRAAQRNDAGAGQADGVGRGGGRQFHGRRIGGCRVDDLVKLDKDRPRGQVDRRAGQPWRPVVLYDVRRIGRRSLEHAVVRVAHGRRRDVDRGVAGAAGAVVRPRDRRLLCRGQVDGDCGGRPRPQQRSARERRRAAGAVAAHYRNAREVDGPGGHGGVKGERYGPGGKVHGSIHNARRPCAGRRRGHRQARGRQQGTVRRVARKVRKRAGGRLVDAHGAARVVVQRARRGGLGRRKPHFQHC